jgi:hypothetical protein
LLAASIKRNLLEAAMRKTSLFAALVLSTLGGAIVACDEEEDEFDAELSAAAEIPTPVGSPTATGLATLELDDDVLTVNVNVSGNLTSDVTMAHIHGPATTSNAANIILDFVPTMTAVINAGTRTGTIVSASYNLAAMTVSSTGELRVDRGTLLDWLRTGQAYVNVHTVNNPTGEIRGQIRSD